MEASQEKTFNKANDYLERTMLSLSPLNTETERKMYIMGCIETLEFGGAIDEETTEELLLRYGI